MIAAVAVTAVIIAIGASWWAFTEHRWLLDPVATSLNIVLVFAATGLVKFMRTEAERRTVRSAFAQYLPPDVVESIANDPSQLELGGDTRELTIMFCDIRGFTPIAESFRSDPQGLTKLINRALTPLSREVLNHRGTIDKYIGDCVMAFWNAPIDDAEHATHACDCALGMLDALVALNQELTAEGFYQSHKVNQIAVSIGLNTGVCVVGNMGPDLRFDYSALGDAVNVSARIQSFAGNYGFPIAIGEAHRDDRFREVRLPRTRLHRRQRPRDADPYLRADGPRPCARDEDVPGVERRAADAVHRLPRAEWAAAKEAIAKGRTIPGAPAEIFALYEDRIAHFELEPPPANWDGAWAAKEK